MKIFLSLRVTADAEGGLKGPAQLRRSLRGLGGGGHQQASAGIYRGIACYYHIPLPVEIWIAARFKCFLFCSGCLSYNYFCTLLKRF